MCVRHSDSKSILNCYVYIHAIKTTDQNNPVKPVWHCKKTITVHGSWMFLEQHSYRTIIAGISEEKDFHKHICLYQTCRHVKEVSVAVYLLFQKDLRCSFAVEAEASIRHLHHGAHGLAYRVERVHLVELLLWDLLSHRDVISLQVQQEAQETTLCLITNLLGQTTFNIWWLKENTERDAEKANNSNQ